MVQHQSLKRYAYIVFALIILIMNWEYNTTNSALAEADIPEESIRLRILAHSDSPQEQWIKLKIRDEIVQHMRKWVQDPKHIEEAREEVQRHLPAFEQLVGDVLQYYGFSHSYTVELAIVDFPTKIYGTKLYPAGDYEALRVIIGEGKGDNWWCVLFPPLCFVDITTSVTIEPDKIDANQATEQNINETNGKLHSEEIETRFFIWDMLQKFVGFIKGLFA